MADVTVGRVAFNGQSETAVEKLKRLAAGGRTGEGSASAEPPGETRRLIQTANSRGGRRNPCVAATQLPPKALLRAAAILTRGLETHGRNNWRRLGVQEHLDHAGDHLLRYMAGEKGEDHLGHALCRLLFACEMEAAEGRPDFSAEADECT